MVVSPSFASSLRLKYAASCMARVEAPEMRRWLYVLCGPPPMMAAVEDALIELGVPAGRIVSERFTYD